MVANIYGNKAYVRLWCSLKSKASSPINVYNIKLCLVKYNMIHFKTIYVEINNVILCRYKTIFSNLKAKVQIVKNVIVSVIETYSKQLL